MGYVHSQSVQPKCFPHFDGAMEVDPCRMGGVVRGFGMKSPLLLLLPLVLLPLSMWAEDQSLPKSGVAKKEKKEQPDFVRFKETETSAQLETAIKSYTNPDGVTVDMVGVVHIADASYYEKLNEELAKFEIVLYELVGDPSALQKQKGAVESENANPLRGMQKLVGSLLKLSFQLDHIDYTRSNFTHADMSVAEFREEQKARGENLMSLLGRAMKLQTNDNGGLTEKDLNIDLPQLLAMLNGSEAGADSLKILMAKVFDQAEGLIAEFEGDDEANATVLLTGRNKFIMAKLTEAMSKGKKRIAIFYGAGHLPGLDGSLREMKFTQTAERWISAWTMKTAKKP